MRGGIVATMSMRVPSGETMNLPRLRELVKAGQEGSIRPDELQELFAALPEVLDALESDPEAERDCAASFAHDTDLRDFYAGSFGY